MNPNQLAPDEQSALEQTTAPRTVSSVGLSADNVAERDAYLQLGQLLERAAGEFDEQAFLGKLQGGMKEAAPSVVVRPTAVRPRKGNELWIAISIAAAAVVVVGAGIWFSRGNGNVVKKTTPPSVVKEAPAIVHQPVQKTIPAPQQVIPQNPSPIVQTPSIPTTPARDWTDPLDERIAEVRDQIREVARPYLMDAPLQLISEQVRELQEELDAGTL